MKEKKYEIKVKLREEDYLYVTRLASELDMNINVIITQFIRWYRGS